MMFDTDVDGILTIDQVYYWPFYKQFVSFNFDRFIKQWMSWESEGQVRSTQKIFQRDSTSILWIVNVRQIYFFDYHWS